MPNSSPIYMIYTGPSMSPTLKTGDMLYVVPYNDRKVRRGDVVVFPAPDGNRRITHRVISVVSGRIRTLGDNNTQVDDYVLYHDNLVGRVVYAFRKNRRLCIYGGVAGRMYAMKVRSTRYVRPYVYSALRPFYHHLIQCGILRRYIFPCMKTRIVSFNRPEGMERQLFVGQRMIGRYIPGNAQWQIKPLFRLFVDESSLPTEDLNS